MGDCMKETKSHSAPPKSLQGFVGAFLPPNRREQVLGDLEEQYCSAPPRRALPRYLFEAIALVPTMLVTQKRRFFVGSGVPQPLPISSGIGDVRRRVEDFQHETFCRFLFYLGMISLICAWFTWQMISTESWLARTVMGTFIATYAFTVWQHYVRAPAHAVPEEALLPALIAFYRRQLALRRDFLRTLWYWKMLPMAAPFLFILALKRDGNLASSGMWMVGIFLFANFAARKYARGVQERIDELTILENPASSGDAG
jgi:hypothetical protein